MAPRNHGLSQPVQPWNRSPYAGQQYGGTGVGPAQWNRGEYGSAIGAVPALTTAAPRIIGDVPDVGQTSAFVAYALANPYGGAHQLQVALDKFLDHDAKVALGQLMSHPDFMLVFESMWNQRYSKERWQDHVIVS